MSFSTTARPWLQGASLFLTVAATIAIASAVAMGGGGPHNVLIVGNRASDDSLAVANAYRQARDIPQSNLCLLDIDATLFQEDQSIDWEVYLESVRGPIADFLARHPSPGTLNFVVLTLDLPLRVKLPEDNSARAATHRSLSSMLTLLPEEAPTAAVTNPYSRAGGGFSRWLSTAAAERRRPNFRLVTMLGGYTRADALSLISRSVAADGTSPKGHFYFVESQHAVGFREADEWLREQGFESTHLDDLSGVTNFKDVMGHFSGGAYSKLTWPQIQSSSIRPGALVDMLQSYGALSYNWRGFAFASHVPLGWWIRAGASGVHGATDEPYAHTFPTSGLMQIVLGSYISGCNLAESYWSGLRQLVWQNIVLGDALCAPYARRAEMSLVAHPEENGRILLSLKATLPQGREFGHAMLFVDGATVSNPKLIITPPAATTPSADGVAGQTSARLPTIYQWELAANDLTPGHHRARAVI